jgi:hypothetical protein
LSSEEKTQAPDYSLRLLLDGCLGLNKAPLIHGMQQHGEGSSLGTLLKSEMAFLGGLLFEFFCTPATLVLKLSLSSSDRLNLHQTSIPGKFFWSMTWLKAY